MKARKGDAESIGIPFLHTAKTGSSARNASYPQPVGKRTWRNNNHCPLLPPDWNRRDPRRPILGGSGLSQEALKIQRIPT